MRRIIGARRAAPHRVIGIAQQAEAAFAGWLHRRIIEIAGQIIAPYPEQGEIIGRQPIEKRHGFGSAMRRDRRRVAFEIPRRLAQRAEHCLPIGDRGIDIGKHLLQRRNQLAPGFGAGALDFDIDHRFAGDPGCCRAGGEADHFDQHAIAVAAHIDDRVEQPVDIEPGSGDGRRGRIDEERPILANDRQRHAATPRRDTSHAVIDFGRIEMNDRNARRTHCRRSADEMRDCSAAGGIETFEFTGQRRIEQGAGKCLFVGGDNRRVGRLATRRGRTLDYG